jgi:hypothetical protein
VIAAKVIMCKDKFYGMGIGPFYIFFFERKCGRGSPYSDFGFLKIRTQIRVCGDLNLGGWVVHPLP